MHSVLLQELVRYNNLHRVITTTLRDIDLAMKGIVVMSETLEQVLLTKLFI